jgi:hypothetical protein
MKTAVLLGFNGVLARPTYERGRSRLAALARRPLPDANGIFESDRYLAFASGQLSAENFLVGLGKSLGIDAPYESLVDAWNESLTPWTEVADVVGRTMAGEHPVYLVATIDPLRVAHLEPVIPQMRRLAGRYLSFDAHTVQPDPAFTAAALARFHLQGAQCVFIESTPGAVEAARMAGVPGFHFTGDVRALVEFLRRWDHEV